MQVLEKSGFAKDNCLDSASPGFAPASAGFGIISAGLDFSSPWSGLRKSLFSSLMHVSSDKFIDVLTVAYVHNLNENAKAQRAKTGSKGQEKRLSP